MMPFPSYSVSKSNVDEAPFATCREGVDRPTSSKGSNTYRSLEARWHFRRCAPPETTKYTFDLEME